MRRWSLLVLACGCNAVYGIDETGVVNDNPRTLIFDNADSEEDLVGFPVPVFLDDTRVTYANVLTPETDLRFHDPDTSSDLPFEIEVWNPAGTSVVWVRVPQIDARSTTDRILMYAGPDAAGTANASALWSDYALVVHGTGGNASSAAQTFTTTQMGVGRADGAVGDALAFSRTSLLAYTAPGNQLLDGWPTFTLEVSIYLDYDGVAVPGGEPRWLENDGAAHLGRFLPRANLPQVLVLQTDWTFEAGATYVQAAIVVRRWAHVTYSYDGKTLWLYRDGVVSGVDAFPALAPLLGSANRFELGHATSSFIGRLDEIRVSREYRSAAWIYAQDLARRDKLITFPRPGERL